MKKEKISKEHFNKSSFDIIVVGGGHAGCEAALVSARMGCKTLLLTMNLDTIAQMSCNPAIGGVAKGQLVREIDALGGEMGKVADKAGLQFRMLNKSKGPAVWSPRAQCDKLYYKMYMKHILEQQENLYLHQEEVVDILISGNKIVGVETKNGLKYFSKAVILTTGTFLNGLIHVGLKNFPSGRMGEFASFGISKSLKKFGFEIKRLKTGTPPRINGRTIDFSKLEPQYGDEDPVPFSHFTSKITQEQLPCWIAYTNEHTHKIILKNLDRSPLYTGVIKSVGPRYCPSIEDKIMRFKDRDRHQIFLEPEGYNTNEYYCNGISTSLPEDVQGQIVHSISGCEKAEILRYGYAIEYDFCPPTQLYPTLETKLVDGLFFAGQINGTTGYEEAAAQGLIAGINAVLKIRGEEPFVLRRDEAYIGVLIDDLVTKGVMDPYRMFTSRAEYRLMLRTDNADLRLMSYGYKFGLIKKEYYEQFERYRKELLNFLDFIRKKRIREKNETVFNLVKQGKLLEEVIDKNELEQYVKSFDEKNKDICCWTREKFLEQVHIQIKYSGYIERQINEVEKMQRLENKKIPEDFDYSKVKGLLKEAVIKLSKIKPKTIGQASRISGVTPSDISILLIYLKKYGAGKG
ncbi:MAG: tRNA uridine-5-carboxymethylaminomethyl(34) synthesis enzyme MnmG [Endomicrobiia bacterium]